MELRSKSCIYKISNVISQGESSTVCEAFRKDLKYPIGQKVLLKIFKPHSKSYPLELDSLLQVRSPHCVSVLHFDIIEKKPALILEWVDGINLFQLQRQTTPLNSLEISYICWSCQQGLIDLHQQGLCHGDLSPPNILIDRKGRVLLIDFGKGNYMGDHVLTTSGFTAPEVLKGKTPDFYSDLFSLGMIEKFLKGHPLENPQPQTEEGLLDSFPENRYVKNFIFHKAARQSLAIKVKSLMHTQIHMDQHPLQKKKKNFLPPLLLFLSLFLAGSRQHQKTGSVSIRSHKWLSIEIHGKTGFTPFNSGPLAPGVYTMKWKNKTRQGKTMITIKENSHTLLTEKDLLLKQ